ncbi:PAS domain S-box protein [Vibrio sp. JC009]|uniref:FIST N-terminal domain-containing protein n=1 Tax=Vibrio sp. JC009 TaxID=2912314 RepID=UPI0023B02B1D|nr:FIST N-terminal domain-containing protein [Vibrio sp. JC009]WED23437.1 PAS domain S-box protein [Vibrio sp. JC009]
MRLYNHSFQSLDKFQAFISVNGIPDNSQVLIQVFISGKENDEISAVLADIREVLPRASIIGTTTAGVIADGDIIDDDVIISLSVFESTSTETISYSGLSPEEIVSHLHTRINQRTKLAIIFANTYRFNSPELLKSLTEKHPDLAIVGGNAGDGIRFQKCTVCTEKTFDDDVVIGLLDSDVLQVDTNYRMNLQEIGAEFTITKSEGNTVYEINGKPTLDIYEKYLGAEVASNPAVYGNSFPLLFTKTKVNIARGPVAADKTTGSVTYAGDVPQGTTVRFGFANAQQIEKENQKDLLQRYEFYNEAAYIYSCAARRQIIGVSLNSEIRYLNKVAPTSGFITYGEYFHDKINVCNSFLNDTTTYVVLNESTPSEKLSITVEPTEKDMESVRLNALSNFIAETGKELDETIHYLGQFRKCVDEAAILSTTDETGHISSVNQNLVDVSGYTERELLGMSHDELTDSDTVKEIRDELLNTITSGKMWKGLVKNRKKDGTPYFVLVEISPIYNKDGSVREYLSIRNDVTELQEYRKILEDKLDITTATLKEKIHYTSQYEDAVNSAIAVVKTNNDYVITYANKKMVELSGYSHDELIGTKSEKFRHSAFAHPSVGGEIRTKLAKKQRVEDILVNVAKDGQEYTVSNLFVPILDLDGKVIENLVLMHDITDITKLSDEILATQKEVVFTLGAIAESRSKETGMHVKRVAEYSYLLARLYGLNDKEAELLKQASPMHDIGKVGIPDDILNKPDKLTRQEFEIMKTHAELGYEMLKHSQREIFKASATVAHEHHEKWDGSGYPRGLKGEDIHIYGRITAVADVFDALAQDRPYKEAWNIYRILDLFEKERGKHFDPHLIDLFLGNIDKFLEIKYTLR